MKKRYLLLLFPFLVSSCTNNISSSSSEVNSSTQAIIDPSSTSTSSENEDVKVQAVYFLDDSISLSYTGMQTLKYKVLPENATNQAVKIEIMDESIVQLKSDNTIVGLKIGTTSAKITSLDTNVFDYVKISVNKGIALPASDTVFEQTYNLMRTMTNYKINLTSNVTTAVMDMDRYYTENYYYENNNRSASSSYGYAKSNDGKVFKYYQDEDKQIVPLENKSENGQYVSKISQVLTTFNTLPEYSSSIRSSVGLVGDYKYQITDRELKIVFATSSHLISKIVDYLTCIYVEPVIENDKIVSIKYTLDGEENLLGSIEGVISDFDSVELKEIDTYVKAGKGGGPIVTELQEIHDFLVTNSYTGYREALKKDEDGNYVYDEDGNYVRIKSKIEYYTPTYYLSVPTSDGLALDSTLVTKGYITLDNDKYSGIYSFTLDANDNVVLGDLVGDLTTYPNGVRSFLLYPSFFACLDMIDTLTYSEVNDCYATQDTVFTTEFANYFGYQLEDASYGGAFKANKDSSGNIETISIWYLFTYYSLTYLEHKLDFSSKGKGNYPSVDNFINSLSGE